MITVGKQTQTVFSTHRTEYSTARTMINMERTAMGTRRIAHWTSGTAYSNRCTLSSIPAIVIDRIATDYSKRATVNSSSLTIYRTERTEVSAVVTDLSTYAILGRAYRIHIQSLQSESDLLPTDVPSWSSVAALPDSVQRNTPSCPTSSG